MWVHAEKAENRICRCGLSCSESRVPPPAAPRRRTPLTTSTISSPSRAWSAPGPSGIPMSPSASERGQALDLGIDSSSARPNAGSCRESP